MVILGYLVSIIAGVYAGSISKSAILAVMLGQIGLFLTLADKLQ